MLRTAGKCIEIALTTTAPAYSANDQVDTTRKVAYAVLDSGGAATLASLSINDGAKQKQALDVYFFSQDPSIVTTDNNAADIPAASMAYCLGAVNVPATAYKDVASRSVATVPAAGLKLQAAAKSKDLYILVVTRGTPTYGASSTVLSVVLGLDQN